MLSSSRSGGSEAACPFCAHRGYSVSFTGPKTAAQRAAEEREAAVTRDQQRRAREVILAAGSLLARARGTEDFVCSYLSSGPQDSHDAVKPNRTSLAGRQALEMHSRPSPPAGCCY